MYILEDFEFFPVQMSQQSFSRHFQSMRRYERVIRSNSLVLSVHAK